MGNRFRYLTCIVTLLFIGGAGVSGREAAAAPADYDAQIKKIQIDRGLTPGRKYPVRVTVKNTGRFSWRGMDGVELICQNTEAPGVPKEAAFGFREKLVGTVEFEKEVEFRGEVTAPLRYGEWQLTCQMFRKGTGLIGKPESIKVEVTKEYDGRINLVRIPKLYANRKNAITVKVENAGDSEWIPGEVFLRMQIFDVAGGKLDKVLEDALVLEPLKEAVKPGDTAEFTMYIRPNAALKLRFEFVMWDAKDKKEFGNEKTATELVN
jgi:hypothetical protein